MIYAPSLFHFVPCLFSSYASNRMSCWCQVTKIWLQKPSGQDLFRQKRSVPNGFQKQILIARWKAPHCPNLAPKGPRLGFGPNGSVPNGMVPEANINSQLRASRSLWEASGKLLGSCGKPLGSFWGASGKPVGSFWEPLGSLWDAFKKLLGALWKLLETSRKPLGSF